MAIKIESVLDEAFRPYGRVWSDVPQAYLVELAETLEHSTPMPEGRSYSASDPALENMACAPALSALFFGGRPAQLGWCNGHNTKLNCLEYHRASEFNFGPRDFILLLAREEQIIDGELDTSLVRAFHVPANTLIEVYGSTLHYAPCQACADEGYKVLVALPQGTNGPKPALPRGAQGGDAAMLWAADKWLIVHEESGKGELGAWVGLVGENIDIADSLASDAGAGDIAASQA